MKILVRLFTVVALTLWAATANAALMQHLHTTPDEAGYWGWGDIIFKQESCDDDGCQNQIESFAFTQLVGTVDLGNYELNFAKSDIIGEPFWSINTDTWDLEDLGLATDWVEAIATTPDTTQVIYGRMDFYLNGVRQAMVSLCFDEPIQCGNAHEVRTYALHAEHKMPLPSTVALIVLGLAGLRIRRKAT